MAAAHAARFVSPGELGAFLRARRNEVAAPPAATGRARRVPGLRREEVAHAAGISLDYYARLEQGRERSPSPQVLGALARALALAGPQRRYLFALAGLAAPPQPDGDTELPAALVGFVRAHASPVFAVGTSLDVLALSEPSRRLFSGFRSSNLLEMIFLEPHARSFFRDWPGCARWSVSLFRLLSLHAADHEAPALLLDRLLASSREFDELWTSRELDTSAARRVAMVHPALGDIVVDTFTLELADHPGHRLILCRSDAEIPWSTARDPGVQRAELGLAL